MIYFAIIIAVIILFFMLEVFMMFEIIKKINDVKDQHNKDLLRIATILDKLNRDFVITKNVLHENDNNLIKTQKDIITILDGVTDIQKNECESFIHLINYISKPKTPEEKLKSILYSDKKREVKKNEI